MSRSMSVRMLASTLGIASIAGMCALRGYVRNDNVTPPSEQPPGAAAQQRPLQADNAAAANSRHLRAERCELESCSSHDHVTDRSIRRAAYIRIAGEDLTTSDRQLLDRVNWYLKHDGLQAIPLTHRIAEEDLPVFREIVDSNRAAIDKAEKPFTMHQLAILRDEWHRWLPKIRARATEGLPLKSATNRMRRRHPHEAIRMTIYKGQKYVLRVHPRDDAKLTQLGTAFDAACDRQTAEFDTLVRRLFR